MKSVESNFSCAVQNQLKVESEIRSFDCIEETIQTTADGSAENERKVTSERKIRIPVLIKVIKDCVSQKISEN